MLTRLIDMVAYAHLAVNDDIPFSYFLDSINIMRVWTPLGACMCAFEVYLEEVIVSSLIK